MSQPRYIAAEVLKSFEQTADRLGLVLPVEVLPAQIGVLGAVAKHVEGSGEHRGGHGEDGLLGAATGLDAQGDKVKLTVNGSFTRAGESSWAQATGTARVVSAVTAVLPPLCLGGVYAFAQPLQRRGGGERQRRGAKLDEWELRKRILVDNPARLYKF